METNAIVDSTSVEAAPAEALMLLWELEFGTFPSAGDCRKGSHLDSVP